MRHQKWGPSHHSRRLLIEAQIFRAGPSLMFMVEIRWSSLSSNRACPSISCDRNWVASSSQPKPSRKPKRRVRTDDLNVFKQSEANRDLAANLEARRWTCRLLPRSTEPESRTGSWPLRSGDFQVPSCRREERCAQLWSTSVTSFWTARKSHPPLPPPHWTRLLSDWTLSGTTRETAEVKTQSYKPNINIVMLGLSW